MEISVSDEGRTARVVLVGRLDIQGAQVVALPLATIAGGKQHVIVDLSGVNFIASIGIRQLVEVSKTLSRRGGRLVLVSPTDVVSEVITAAGLMPMFSVASSESEARLLIG